MSNVPAMYLGRLVDKEKFRTFIYGPKGLKKLAESWDDYEAQMASGLWFPTAEEAEASVAEVKPKPKKARPALKPKEDEVLEVLPDEEVLPDDDSVFEVTDDFLPKETK